MTGVRKERWLFSVLGFCNFVALAMACFLPSCQLPNINDDASNDRLLARVHNRRLYLSELDGMFPTEASSKDSTSIISAFVDRWIREVLLLHEAERNVPKDLNIDKLVRDYRASLIRHNYERFLVEQLLDSTITQQELSDFYEKNKEQYQLETAIMRCNFIKIPIPVPDANDLRRLWNNSSSEAHNQLSEYCIRNAEAHQLNDSLWFKVDEIAKEMPAGTLTYGNVESKRDFSQRDDNYQYYLKVFEVKNRKEIAPLGYIENQARKVILRRRQLKLLEQKMDDLYEVEIRRNNIELFED